MGRDRDRWLRQLEALDPVADHEAVYRISVGYEFTVEYEASLGLALFRLIALVMTALPLLKELKNA